MGRLKEQHRRAGAFDWVVEKITQQVEPVSPARVNEPNQCTDVDELAGAIEQAAQTLMQREHNLRVLEVASVYPPQLLDWASKARIPYAVLSNQKNLDQWAARHPHVRVYSGQLASFARKHREAFDWVCCPPTAGVVDASRHRERLAMLAQLVVPAGYLTVRTSFAPSVCSWFRFRELLEQSALPPISRVPISDGTFLITSQKKSATLRTGVDTSSRRRARRAA